MAKKLKPCPFCGSDDVEPTKGGGWPDGSCYWVECNNCNTEGPRTEVGKPKLRDIAIKKWNTRPKGCN